MKSWSNAVVIAALVAGTAKAVPVHGEEPALAQLGKAGNADVAGMVAAVQRFQNDSLNYKLHKLLGRAPAVKVGDLMPTLVRRPFEGEQAFLERAGDEVVKSLGLLFPMPEEPSIRVERMREEVQRRMTQVYGEGGSILAGIQIARSWCGNEGAGREGRAWWVAKGWRYSAQFDVCGDHKLRIKRVDVYPLDEASRAELLTREDGNPWRVPVHPQDPAVKALLPKSAEEFVRLVNHASSFKIAGAEEIRGRNARDADGKESGGTHVRFVTGLGGKAQVEFGTYTSFDPSLAPPVIFTDLHEAAIPVP